METVSDGFKLSEIDLKYRGPGEFMGTRQAGETDLPLGVLTDEAFVIEVRRASEMLWNEYRTDAERFVSQDSRAMIIA
jgi:ATP-dependent DNA helicase RecG